mmetsp:Transcript_20601/g.48410  ORF Transcript_20601/g.48410 Transcript_20601/m.48410 type:complete len:93 (+) Transcript_20601:63-341(+)
MVRKEVVLLWYISLSLKKSKRTIVYLVAHRFQETNRTRLQCLGLTIGLTIGTNMDSIGLDWIGLDSIHSFAELCFLVFFFTFSSSTRGPCFP